MKPKLSAVYVRLGIMALCVVGGALIHTIYQRYVASTVVTSVLVNALALAGLYLYMHAHQWYRRRNAARRMNAALDAVRHETPLPEADPEDDYAPVLENIQALAAHITERERTRSDILTLLNSVASNMELESMLNALLPKILSSSASAWGAFYLANETTGKLEIKASVGFSKNIYSEFDINIGEGFIGMAAHERETQVVADLPDDSVFVTRTFLGKLKPKGVMAVPIVKQEELVGVLAIASLSPYTAAQQATVRIIQEHIGAAVANSVAFEHSKRLMGELRFQNNLIRDLYDEMENKTRDTMARTDENAKLVAELCGRVMSGEAGAVVLTDARGVALYAAPNAVRILTASDGDLTGADVFALFTEPEWVAAFARAGGGTERFHRADGEAVSVTAFAAQDADGQARYMVLRLEAV